MKQHDQCRVCGERYDLVRVQTYTGSFVYACQDGDCQQELEREDQDAEEYAYQEAHAGVDRQFGR